MIYFPFDSVVTDDGQGNLSYDREFNSANLRKIFHGLYTNGVAMSDNSAALQVSPVSGLNVSVGTGFVIIEGAMGCLESAETVAVDAAHETYTRIDSIMVRLNTNTAVRCISIEYVKGTPASAPSAPAAVRSGGIYDLRLANIRVPAGATAITGSMITDTRLGNECGIATARPQELDTTAIFAQYQAALAEYMQYVQDCIDETTAGNMQNQITDLTTAINNLNSTMATANKLITELVTPRDIKSGFSFSNEYWHVDNVQCIGRLVFLKGSLDRAWRSGNSEKKSEEGSSDAVYLTVPSGYQPSAPAELIFGCRSSAYNNIHDYKVQFQINPDAVETFNNGSTKHLIYGYAYNLGARHHFQIIYVRSGSVSDVVS